MPDRIGGGNFVPGDAVVQIGPIGLSNAMGLKRYVLEVHGDSMELSTTKDGPPILDHTHKKPWQVPVTRFSKAA